MHLAKLLPIAVSTLAITACADDDSSSDSQSLVALRQEQVAAVLQANVDLHHRHGVVGVVAQVSDGEMTVQARSGESSLDSGVPVAFDTHFRMGSNTKTFVAVVVLQLAEEGVLSLDDRVERWLPGVVDGNGNDGSKITIRQLLQHTTGLRNYTADLFPTFGVEDYYRVRFEEVSPEELVDIALAHPPDFEPGTSWNYSNTNYILAGMVIEQATGHHWASEVRSRILEPLGMTETFDPGSDPELPEPHSVGYNLFAEGDPLVDVTSYKHTWAGAAGSLVTTMDDLTRFWRALLSGELLAPAQLTEMQTAVPAVGLDGVLPGAVYGLGIIGIPTSCGGEYWSHLGDTFGFTTRPAASPDGTRTVVLSNSTSFDVEQSALQVIRDDLELLDEIMCLP